MSKRFPSVESLRVLEACVRHANFTRAADELGVTPAAVGLRIRNLEAELGTALFRRSGPRVTPTAAAVALASRIAEALDLVRVAVEGSRRITEVLRVTAVPSFARHWLTPRLPRYHLLPEAMPIRLDPSTELRPSDDFDLAIRTGRGDWSGFDATPFMPVEATPMLSPALAASIHLASPADLAKLPLLAHDDWPSWFHQTAGRVPKLRFSHTEYATHDLDAAAAIEDAGVALLSPTLFSALIRERNLIQPFAYVLRGSASHHLLTKRNDTRPAVRSFRSWLQNELS